LPSLDIRVQVAGITQRKHYKEAIGVARDALARMPAESAEIAATRELIAQTEAKFATHLLERAGEPEAAMQHYIQTIGYGAAVLRYISSRLCAAVLPSCRSLGLKDVLWYTAQ
jgi:hypothetical protein